MRKPRSDAKLKTLPLDVQKRIVQIAESLSLEETVETIQKDMGVSVAVSTLSDFLAWFHVARKMEEFATFADEVKRVLKEMPDINLSDDQLSRAAQAAFEVRAVKEDDAKLYLALRSRRHRDAELEIARDRLNLDISKLEQQVREYQEKNAAAKATLEGMKQGGGLSPVALEKIEAAARML